MPKDIASPSQGAFCTSPATAVEETSNGWANRGAIFSCPFLIFLQPAWVQILSDYAHRYNSTSRQVVSPKPPKAPTSKALVAPPGGEENASKNKANCAGSFNIHGFMYDLYWIVLNPYWWFQLRLSRITRASHPTQTITNKLKHPRLNCHTFEGHSLGIYAVLTCQDFVPQILPPAVFQL